MNIFENGIFISCEDDNRIFSTLIEDSGKIIFTGDSVPEEFQHIPSRSDMKGRCIVPAFADAHLHFASYALFQATLDVRHARDFGELKDIIQQYEKDHPKEKVILGFGSSAHTVAEKRLPDRRLLDGITSRPLLLIKYDGHAAAANSALLKKLSSSIAAKPGYDKENGWLFQDAFYGGVNQLTKSVPPYQMFKNLISGNEALAAQGIGLVHTSEGVGFPLDIDVDMMRVAAKGFPLQYRIFFQTMDTRKVLKRGLPAIGGCFATALDGCLGSEDAALNEPYANNAGNKGVLFYSQQQVNHFVMSAHRAGLQIAMHAIGDAAIEQAIAAYEAALSEFPRSDHRHIIIHGDIFPEPLLARAARLGLHLSVQPPFLYWHEEPMTYLSHILGDRAVNLLPLKSMLDHGLTIAGSSDAPCTLPHPMQSIYAACNHPNPEQRITALDALRMHTIWAARLSFDDGERGTLTKGKTADFTILDRNPLAVSTDQLGQVRVVDLYLKGERYQKRIHDPLELLSAAVRNTWFS